ncbi:TonB-dependent receptor [Chitinophaga lutea]|uniref:TonB-dependent receptor n=1 Tax=Chitinophaga lutea TaxID=2488634 RepID=A0A3N4QAP8_9BACT|nr:outer membrane beta-barrel family protein [Chitinophaga lutea]RPE13077.1 TonB-dependent receptor [Chitinophaga lutea]
MFRSVILICTLAMSARAADIKVNVTDSTGTAIPNASLSLHSPNAVLKHAVTDSSGNAIFREPGTGRYFIGAAAAGFRSARTASFSWPQNDTLITLVLQSSITQLAGVTVAAAKPLLEAVDDRVIFNVDRDPSLAGLSASDAFAKVPFVSVDGEGRVQLKGQSSFQILVNGKQTAMFAHNPGDVLKSFPASLISRIEVITQPSSKYEGEGITGLINIITKRKVAGYNSSTALNYNTLGQINPNTSFNLKYGKIGITSFLYYAKNLAWDTHGFQHYTALTRPAAFAFRESADTTRATRYMGGGNLEIAYEPDSMRTLSLYGRLQTSGRNTRQRSRLTTYDDHLRPLQQSLLETGEETGAPGGEVGLDYQQQFKNPQKSLSFGMNLQANRQLNNLQSAQYNTSSESRFLRNTSEGRNFQTSYQADYAVPLSPSFALETGARGILRRVRSDYRSLVKDGQTGEYTPDPDNNDRLKYSQDVWGAYATGVYKTGKNGFTIKGGGRLEKTSVRGHFIHQQTTVRQDYYSFLPGLAVHKTLKNGKRLSLAYSRRLARPGLTFLNPYTDNRDPLFISYGNERLQPEFANNAEITLASFSSRFSYSLALSGSFNNSGIQRYLVFDESTGISTQTYDNIGRSRIWGINGYVSFNPAKQFSATLNFNGYYASLRNTKQPAENRRGAYGSFSSAIMYKPAERLMFFSNLTYTAQPLQLQGRNGDYLFYNIGGGYWLLKKKLMLSLAALNFMDKYWQSADNFSTAVFRQRSGSYRPARCLSIGLRYNFGKLTENTSRKKGVNIDDAKQDVNNR